MIQIREVLAAETSEFLRIMCEAFDLDMGTSKALFFSEPRFSATRRIALFDGETMSSIISITPLTFGWGKAIGIAGVATIPSKQRLGFGRRLLLEALQRSHATGAQGAMLYAKEATLYERAGFRVVDEVIRGRLAEGSAGPYPKMLEPMEVRTRYERWANGNPARLQRTELEWKRFDLRMPACVRAGDGYVSLEADLVREAVWTHAPERPVAPRGAEWLGSRLLAQNLGLRLASEESVYLTMTTGFPSVPEMFMTDQF